MNLFSFLRKYFKDEEFKWLNIEKEAYKIRLEDIQCLYSELKNLKEFKKELPIKEEYWNNKHTKKDIFYLGRSLKTKTNDCMLTCDVKNFITPNDSLIQKEIKDNDLTIINKVNSDDEVIKIYHHCRTGAKYMFDSNQFGKSELWLFPFETLYLNKQCDCEDMSHYIVSMLIGAGLPSFRVRVVCGDTNFGGHSTVYYLADDLKTWIHMNSTGSYDDEWDINNFPTNRDAGISDGIGIKDVWFSFNDKFSWSDFEKASTESDFNKQLKNKIKIE